MCIICLHNWLHLEKVQTRGNINIIVNSTEDWKMWIITSQKHVPENSFITGTIHFNTDLSQALVHRSQVSGMRFPSSLSLSSVRFALFWGVVVGIVHCVVPSCETRDRTHANIADGAVVFGVTSLLVDLASGRSGCHCWSMRKGSIESNCSN